MFHLNINSTSAHFFPRLAPPVCRSGWWTSRCCSLFGHKMSKVCPLLKWDPHTPRPAAKPQCLGAWSPNWDPAFHRRWDHLPVYSTMGRESTSSLERFGLSEKCLSSKFGTYHGHMSGLEIPTAEVLRKLPCRNSGCLATVAFLIVCTGFVFLCGNYIGAYQERNGYNIYQIK